MHKMEPVHTMLQQSLIKALPVRRNNDGGVCLQSTEGTLTRLFPSFTPTNKDGRQVSLFTGTIDQ